MVETADMLQSEWFDMVAFSVRMAIRVQIFPANHSPRLFLLLSLNALHHWKASVMLPLLFVSA